MRWQGKTVCDICSKPVANVGNHFYDARTIHGRWALMCEECWIENTTMQLGIGIGQMYDSKTLKKVV